MKKSGLNPIFWWQLGVIVQLLFLLVTGSHNFDGEKLRKLGKISHDAGVHLLQQNHTVSLTNGIVNLLLTVPDGLVISVTYKGGDNLLETQNKEDDRGYWDLIWNKPGSPTTMDKLEGTSYKIIVQNKDQTEISFTRTWSVGNSRIPLNIDKRFVMLRDSPGFYTYTVLERLKGWPAFDIQEGRVVFKLQENKFHYMAMSDDRQRIMPMPVDRLPGHGQALDYPEAVLLTNPTDPQLKGQVDDKYLYSCDNKDNKVHGWVSSDQAVGFWMITPSDEFRTGGPLKQDLTSHVGPTLLSMFISTHYAGEDLALKFQTGDYWKKVLGPVFVYLNSDPSAKTNPSVLWNDAKQRMQKEVGSWPYSFPLSGDFLKSNQRGGVKGQLLVHDWDKNKTPVPGASAYVGLAPQGDPGSWQFESKGYQFWTQTDRNGNFAITNVVPGTYSLFAWVPGFIGDYKHASDITIKPGSNIQATNVVFVPPRKGATLWEIGVPDRTAAEFFIPDPSPTFKTYPYRSPVEKFRQYGLWARYKDYHPVTDQVYTVGLSDYKRDWFFAHVPKNVGRNLFAATTWQIVFDLKSVTKGGNYTLQLALASANGAEIQVRVNNPNSAALFTTGLIGKDNAVARHGIHGLYHLYSVGIAGAQLVVGKNTIFLTQTRIRSPFSEVMYDYIRLEGAA